MARPSVTHNASQPRQYPIFWQVTRFNQKSGTANVAALSRIVDPDIARLTASWIDENKEGEGNEKIMKKKKKGENSGDDERNDEEQERKRKNPGEMLKRWLFVIPSVSRRKSRANSTPFSRRKTTICAGQMDGEIYAPFVRVVTFTNCGKEKRILRWRDVTRCGVSFSHSLCK